MAAGATQKKRKNLSGKIGINPNEILDGIYHKRNRNTQKCRRNTQKCMCNNGCR